MFHHLKKVISEKHDDIDVLKHDRLFISRTKGRQYEMWDARKNVVGYIKPRGDLVVVDDVPEVIGAQGYVVLDTDYKLQLVVDMDDLTRVFAPSHDNKVKQLGVSNKDGHTYYLYAGDNKDNLTKFAYAKGKGYTFNVFDVHDQNVAQITETSDFPNSSKANYDVTFGEIENHLYRGVVLGMLLSIDWFFYLGDEGGALLNKPLAQDIVADEVDGMYTKNLKTSN